MSEFVRPGSLFEQQPASPAVKPRLHHDIPTSQKQERRLAKNFRGKARDVLNYLIAHGPHTRQELADSLKIKIQTICPIVYALREAGHIVQLETERNGGNLLQASRGEGVR